MTRNFWTAFLASALLTAIAAGACAWLIAWLVTPPPLEKFVSSIFEFQLPKGWQCQQEGSETICRIGHPPYSGICILAMKYRGPDDTFDAYRAHLSRPRNARNRDGSSIQSEVRRVDYQQVAGYTWVNALHYQSEVPGYFTEYHATVTSHVAILVTFSAHRDYVERHKKEFDTMISSLKVHQGAGRDSRISPGPFK